MPAFVKTWWFWAIVGAIVLYWLYSKGYFTIPALQSNPNSTPATAINPQPGVSTTQYDASAAGVNASTIGIA